MSNTSSFCCGHSWQVFVRISCTIISPTPLLAANFVILGIIINTLGDHYSRLPTRWCMYFCRTSSLSLLSPLNRYHRVLYLRCHFSGSPSRRRWNSVRGNHNPRHKQCMLFFRRQDRKNINSDFREGISCSVESSSNYVRHLLYIRVPSACWLLCNQFRSSFMPLAQRNSSGDSSATSPFARHPARNPKWPLARRWRWWSLVSSSARLVFSFGIYTLVDGRYLKLTNLV